MIPERFLLVLNAARGWATAATFLVGLCFIGCAALRAEAAEPARNPTDYPSITIREEQGNSRVYWDDELIVEVRNNRFLRFRATPRDDKWIGNERTSADLCWAYADAKAKGMELTGTAHENHPETGQFLLTILGKKPQFDSEIKIVFSGKWMPEVGKFKYTLLTSLAMSLGELVSELDCRGERSQG